MKTLNINDISSDFDKKEYILNSISNNNIDICFEYISDFGNSVILRSFVWIIADILWVSWKWKSRLVLIIDELNNNAVEYGSKSDDINFMRFSIKSHKIIININVEVEDTWRWRSAKKASDMLKIEKNKLLGDKVRSSPIRWRGLFLIINKLVDKLYFKDSKLWWLIVWINKQLDLEEEIKK